MALKPIEIVLNAKDNASKVFDGLNAKMTAIAAAIAGYFGVNAFSNVITGAGNFEEAMSRVQAATNTSGAELEKLKVAAEQAGATTKFTAIEAASALENLAKAGLNSEQAIAALPAVMNMAQAGGVSLADASERLTGVVMGMGLKFEESGRVADVLAMGANASRTSITGLAEALSYAAPIAKSLNLPLESTVAIMAQFANAGIDASRAGTALNSILAQFSDPASKFREELSALGINTRDFDQALKQLAAAGPNGAEAIRAVGLEAGPALQAALNLGIPALEELRTKLKGAEGSAAATAKIMGDNLNGALKGLSSAWDGVKNTLGTPVLPVLKAGVEELTAALRVAVDNGTIAKFGTALATAFQSAIEWVRQFSASFDFNKTAADMQTFVSHANEVFDKISGYATNAGNIVKLAYGVMSAGTNFVLTGIYSIGEAFAGVARDVMLGVATIRDGLAKITFGELSESFKLAAEDARSTAQGFGEASVAMRVKAVEAFNDMADSAETAVSGFEGLANAAQETKVATTQGADAVEVLREALRKESEAAYAAIEAATKKEEADTAAAIAAQKHALALAENSKAIKELKAEYAQAIKTGDWEAVSRLHQEINAKIKEGEAISKQASVATQQNAAANKELSKAVEGTSVALERKAQLEKADAELALSALTLKKASVSAAIAVAEAQGDEATATRLKIDLKRIEIEIIKATVAVQKIEAEGAIAVAQAKMAELKASGDLTDAKRTELEVAIKTAQAKVNLANATGQSTKALEAEIRALSTGTGAIGQHTAATNANTAATNRRSDAWEKIMMQYTLSADYTKRQIELLKEETEAIEAAAEAKRKYWKVDKEGYSVDANGNRIVVTAETQASLYNKAKDAGLTAEQSRRLADQYAPRQGGPMFDNNAFWNELNQLRQQNELDAEQAANQQKESGQSTKRIGDAVERLEKQSTTQRPPALPAPVPTSTPVTTPAPTPAPTPPQTGGQGGSMGITPAPTHVSHITIPGIGRATAKFDNPSDQAQLESMLRALTSAAGVAQ